MERPSELPSGSAPSKAQPQVRVAYLILTHDNIQHLESLVAALDDEHVKFFVHLDKKARIEYAGRGSNVHVVSRRVNANWGSFGLVSATLILLEEALASDADYFALLSGRDYPIRSRSYFYSLLQAGVQYIDLEPAPLPHKPMSRYEYYYFDWDRRRRNLGAYVMRKIERVLRKVGIKKRIDFTVYTGSQWFVLTRECVEYVLDQTCARTSAVRVLRSCLCPDEAYLHTLIGNSPFAQSCRQSLTFVDWSSDSYPCWINETYLEQFEALAMRDDNDRPYVFARKFPDDSGHLIGLIESRLRSN